MRAVIDGHPLKSRRDVPDDLLNVLRGDDLVFLTVEDEGRNAEIDVLVEVDQKWVVLRSNLLPEQFREGLFDVRQGDVEDEVGNAHLLGCDLLGNVFEVVERGVQDDCLHQGF